MCSSFNICIISFKCFWCHGIFFLALRFTNTINGCKNRRQVIYSVDQSSVNSIVIKKRSINVPANTSTKLSTTDPYTTLTTDIYNGVVRRFTKVTKQLRPAKPVAPFGLCFSTSTAGLKVPDIDFSLPDGKKWTVSTANSIKQITNEVACLAFVDGGATSEPAIVIGTFQFEDNFLEFDLENSTFGFSSSLLRKPTSCANFNFTLTDGP
ncbi:putative aspartic peptidase A1 family, aspartic peptidase domain superfamily, xylanase inhibitor [Helianthus annuus]|uniref:Aspartic peptidase A1 family, aspartic peptidase domain superfamily, xylanase inhibitor n=1 Tax=Helianthus annuus TaxID=4232 RepID=A0A9K3N5W1_HELAN|nr:putative aspartic peptidase A1 family, aspartic peptidase domain superfamily, xylanase inhibitor [Helianthus annuus]